jgi:pyruvate/2-oxoglutarate dehydrogenase complex dihydrolipoamide dehydrogenase (E3) component
MSADLSRDRPVDLLVIGGGTAGIVGSRTAALLGARVVMVERDLPGGDCLFTGCVPSKSLIAAALRVEHARGSSDFGVSATTVDVDTARVLDRVRSVIATIEPHDSASAMADYGVRVVTGEAQLVGPRTAVVDGHEIAFSRALLATGASPAVPDVPGLRDSPHLTSDTIWQLRTLPRRLVVLGGGAIGCELSQALARLGSEVTIVDVAPRLLPREDARASALVTSALEADGVTVLTLSSVERVESDGAQGSVVVSRDGAEQVLAYDALLVAVGRTPRTTGLGLEAAGVAVDEKGYVRVDERLRTTNPRVWAAGDLTPHPQFTHLAGVHASIAASNAVLGLRRRIDLSAVPRVTFTDPEVAAVGVPTGTGEQRRRGTRVLDWQHDRVDRALTDGAPNGFSSIAVDARGRVVGATLVSPRAGETLAELTLAVRTGLRVSAIASTTHPYPTYGDGPWLAAVQDVQSRLGRGAAAAGIRLMRAARPR